MAIAMKKENELRNDAEFWAHVDSMLAKSEAGVAKGAVTDADEFFEQMRAKYGFKARTNR